jgi:hypothetical protein
MQQEPLSFLGAAELAKGFALDSPGSHNRLMFSGQSTWRLGEPPR